MEGLSFRAFRVLGFRAWFLLGLSGLGCPNTGSGFRGGLSELGFPEMCQAALAATSRAYKPIGAFGSVHTLV